MSPQSVLYALHSLLNLSDYVYVQISGGVWGCVCECERERVRNSVWVSVCECENVGESVDEGEGGSKSVDGSISEGVCKNVGEREGEVSSAVESKSDIVGESESVCVSESVNESLGDMYVLKSVLTW